MKINLFRASNLKMRIYDAPISTVREASDYFLFLKFKAKTKLSSISCKDAMYVQFSYAASPSILLHRACCSPWAFCSPSLLFPLALAICGHAFPPGHDLESLPAHAAPPGHDAIPSPQACCSPMHATLPWECCMLSQK